MRWSPSTFTSTDMACSLRIFVQRRRQDRGRLSGFTVFLRQCWHGFSLKKKFGHFIFFRMLLAALCAHVETVYAQSVLRRHGWWQWALLTFCLACDPFLHEFSPEAFGGLMIMWSHANLLKKRHGSALLFLALSSICVGFPTCHAGGAAAHVRKRAG